MKILTPNEIEAVNRAEATALLIRTGYRLYRPEADCDGEDLILRTPSGEFYPVQCLARFRLWFRGLFPPWAKAVPGRWRRVSAAGELGVTRRCHREPLRLVAILISAMLSRLWRSFSAILDS